ncbi:MAG: Spx/MgsR family RNA polymerase-binding regulatory protein [Mycoplasmataceae bacterium]|jgi:regulatory protein spx|nr:Spx/MgsR family RNA polymerase-binding regulatory protein [Mycoplasmataceae bacterium]
MIKLFISNACLGCKKVDEYFKKNNIQFITKDFTKTPLDKQELLDILSLTENGFEDILSVRSKTYKKYQNQINEMPIKEVINLILEKPEILSRPIILQYENDKPYRLLVGYNSEDIQIFLNSNTKKISINNKFPCEFANECILAKDEGFHE